MLLPFPQKFASWHPHMTLVEIRHAYEYVLLPPNQGDWIYTIKRTSAAEKPNADAGGAGGAGGAAEDAENAAGGAEEDAVAGSGSWRVQGVCMDPFEGKRESVITYVWSESESQWKAR